MVSGVFSASDDSLPLSRGAHCVFSCLFHIVWCVKYSHPVLVGGVRECCVGAIVRACGERDWVVVALEVMPDHVHVLVGLFPSVAVSDAVRVLKSVSCRNVFMTFPNLKQERFWGSGL